jgi:hypothetical protein
MLDRPLFLYYNQLVKICILLSLKYTLEEKYVSVKNTYM